MYFEDLSPYCYCLRSNLRHVLNAGWIDSAHPFTIGETSSQFVRKLTALVAKDYPHIDVHANKVRYFHPCNLCGERGIGVKDHHERQCVLGMSEIWIPADGLWYAAPSMVLHYIEMHRYLPPLAFIEAVENMNVTNTYNAQDVYDRLLESQPEVVERLF